MPKWETEISIVNNTGRELKRIASSVPWGKGKNIPQTIKPGAQETIQIYSSAGTSTGIEYTVAYQDVAPAGQASYGTVTFDVDIPYWSKKNKAKANTTGLLRVDGFKEIENGAHDYATIAVIHANVDI